MKRRAESEIMNVPAEVDAYAAADFAAVNQAFIDQLIERCSPAIPRPGRLRAIDIGTGPGDMPVRLLTTLRARRDPWGKDVRIVGLDASAPMLEHARKLSAKAGLIEQIEWVRADAKATGLPTGRFDVLFSNSILHHITDVLPFWREVKRLAAPGAKVFLRDLARPADEPAARRIVEIYAGTEPQLVQDEYFRSLLSAYAVDEVRAQLSQAGLDGLTVAMVTDRHLDVWGRL